MELNEQPSMHRFRRRSMKSLLCLVAITMPLQVLPAQPCMCTERQANSEQVPSMPKATRQHSCCSSKPASCCSDRGVRHCCGCCRQHGQPSPCNCGANCHCSLQSSTPDPPALPPVSSTPLGDELFKSHAVGCHLADTALAGCSCGQRPSSSVACTALTKLELCATFCRFLI